MRVRILVWIGVAVLLLSSCTKVQEKPVPDQTTDKVTIFSINDPHAQINNFSKIKEIIDKAEEEGNVLVVCAGDIFSGNPVVDFVDEKGYPIIDLMNRCGFDVSAIGNHEFDYGQATLSARMEQANFPFICANTDMTASIVPQPDAYTSVSAGDTKITFLGMVQTSYSSGRYIPATHPFKITDIDFQPANDVMPVYAGLKEETGSDLVILLSHLGTWTDFDMARNYPFLDAIIGGHSHAVIDTTINNTPVYQCGSNLKYLGKISLEIKDKEILSEDFHLINLDNYTVIDSETENIITAYNNVPGFDEVIGYNEVYMSRGSSLGCFYTDALRLALGTDISFQNSGGLRADLDQGDITVREIYSIDPFNNGANTYSTTVGDIKYFFKTTGAGLHYSGMIIENDLQDGIIIRDLDGNILPDETNLTLGINDYIPAVYGGYFNDPVVSSRTTAEEIIQLLRKNPSSWNYDGCYRYFKY